MKLDFISETNGIFEFWCYRNPLFCFFFFKNNMSVVGALVWCADYMHGPEGTQSAKEEREMMRGCGS